MPGRARIGVEESVGLLPRLAEVRGGQGRKGWGQGCQGNPPGMERWGVVGGSYAVLPPTKKSGRSPSFGGPGGGAPLLKPFRYLLKSF